MSYSQRVQVEGDPLAFPVPVSGTVTALPSGTQDVNVVSPNPLPESLVGSTSAVASLTAATTGNGSTVDWGAAKTNSSMQIIVIGTVTGGVVDLQVSQDGTNWTKISSSAALGTGVNQQLTISSSAWRYVRAVVSSAVTGGGSVTATFMST